MLFIFNHNIDTEYESVVKYWYENGNCIASYTYDEWGKLLDITATDKDVAEANPLRYRGYYYDNETGYYYLQSRYYDPELGRFISADSFDYVRTNNILGVNIYIYCDNSPIEYYDYNGFVKTKKYGELKGGWKYRIDSENSGTGTRRHIKVWKDGESYQQCDDGSPHDGSTGKPSRKIRNELKDDGIWDWDANEKKYNDSQKESSIDFGDVATVIVYSFLIALAVMTGLFVLVIIFDALPIPIKVPI